MASDDVLDGIREELRLNREVYMDNRAFLRDLTRRNEKVWQEQMAAWREIVERLQDMKSEHRAQLEALFRILDRLEPGGSGSAA